jgi:hypothetical protein
MCPTRTSLLHALSEVAIRSFGLSVARAEGNGGHTYTPMTNEAASLRPGGLCSGCFWARRSIVGF